MQFQEAWKYSIVTAIIDLGVMLVALKVLARICCGCCKKRRRPASTDHAKPAAYDTVPVQLSPPPPVSIHKVPDSEVPKATVEKFLNDIARDKPILFSPQQLTNLTRNYATRLGSGGFGIVYKGWFPNGVPVAVKVLNGNLDKQVEEQFMAEVGTIGRTYHFNFVRLYGFCFDPMVRALVYEYMENGSLDVLLFTKTRGIEWGKLHNIAIGTAKGIAYLHEECQQRIIHYDIKPSNVLLDVDFSPKVADFGLAKLCNRDSTHVTMTGYRGTPGYAAPELWMPMPITHKCDVYSFGVMLFEIIGRRRNLDVGKSGSQEWFPRWVWVRFESRGLGALFEVCGIEKKDREKVERTAMVALWCVQYQPEVRPPMSSVVKMLEGEVEIADPPNPFQHLMYSREGASPSTGSRPNSTPDKSYEEVAAPIMRK